MFIGSLTYGTKRSYKDYICSLAWDVSPLMLQSLKNLIEYNRTFQQHFQEIVSYDDTGYKPVRDEHVFYENWFYLLICVSNFDNMYR